MKVHCKKTEGKIMFVHDMQSGLYQIMGPATCGHAGEFAILSAYDKKDARLVLLGNPEAYWDGDSKLVVRRLDPTEEVTISND